MIRVLVAQDTPLFRGALAALLEREDDIEVVAEVSTWSEVVPAARATKADVTVLDLKASHSTASGEEDQRVDPVAEAVRLCRAVPDVRPLVVLEAGRYDVLATADRAVLWDVGFVTRKASPGHLVSAVRSLANGSPVIDPALVVWGLTSPANPLTPRERNVLTLAAEGAKSSEIAQRLYLSAGTVRNCLSRINVKVGASNRIQAIHRARQAGWI